MKRLTLAQYMSFVTIGLVSSITGPILPAIRREIPMNYGESGLLLASLCIGVILAVPAVGYISDKYGKKPFLMLGGVLLVCGLFGCMLSQSFKSLLVWNIVLGIGFGGFEVGINALCSSMSLTNKGNAMSLLHFFFGLGAIGGPLISTACLRLLQNWRLVYGLAICLPVMVIFILWPLKIPTEIKEDTFEKSIPYWDPFLWVCAAMILVYAGIEISVQGWIAAYWEKIAPRASFPASMVASLFWIALTLGRLFSGRLADCLGLSRFLTFASIGCIALALFWIIMASSWSTLLATLFLGLLLAGIFPTLMVSATSHYPGLTGKVTAFISLFASLGGFFIPSAIGNVADWVGIIKFPVIILGLAVAMALFALGKERLEKGCAAATIHCTIRQCDDIQ